MILLTFEALLLSAWLFPLALGLLQLLRGRALVPLAAFGALPGLLAALLVPAGTVVEVSSLLLGAQFALDETGRAFLLFTGLLWLAAGVFAQAYLREDPRRPRFFAFFLLALAGNLGLIVAGDALGFYLWFALMSFASYGLIVHTGQADAHYAGRVYMVLVVAGEVLLFAALALIAASSGTLLLGALPQQRVDGLSAALVFVAFGIKAGVALLHVWLPLAHPAAPVPASAVLSGAMIKAGVLGWLRFLHPAASAPEWGAALLGLGLATAFYGALVGVSQTNAKVVLAYSSISQMGFIMVGLGAWLFGGGQAALAAVLLYAIHHALAKGALFLGVSFAGAGRLVPLALLLPALALAGLPLTSGAAAKAALKSVTESLPGGWGSLLALPLSLAAAGTTLLMARYLWLIWRSPAPAHPAPRAMWGAWLALLVAVAFLLFVLPEAAPAAAASLKPDYLWPATAPILGGGLLALAAAGAARRAALPPMPLVPPGDLLSLFVVVLRRLESGRRWGGRLLAGLATRLRAQIGPPAGLSAAEAALARLELRLRTDWIAAGSALLLLALSILLLVWLGA